MLFRSEEEIKNLRIAVQGELMQRHFGDAVRLEVADTCSLPTAEFLLQQFSLSETDLYRVDGPVNLYRLREVVDRVDRPDLKYPAFQPALPAALSAQKDVFAVLTLEGSVNARDHIGGTAPRQVRAAVQRGRELLVTR